MIARRGPRAPGDPTLQHLLQVGTLLCVYQPSVALSSLVQHQQKESITQKETITGDDP